MVLWITVTAFLCLINKKEKVQTHSLRQDGSGAHDTNHRTAIINLIWTTQKYFQIQSRRGFFLTKLVRFLNLTTSHRRLLLYLTWFRSFSVRNKKGACSTQSHFKLDSINPLKPRSFPIHCSCKREMSEQADGADQGGLLWMKRPVDKSQKSLHEHEPSAWKHVLSVAAQTKGKTVSAGAAFLSR